MPPHSSADSRLPSFPSSHSEWVALGLMSGTSLDGVDAALIRSDGLDAVPFGASITQPYPPELREQLRAILGESGPEEKIWQIERDITLFHAKVVRALLAQAGLAAGEVDVIGFHGHTIFHRPDQGRTRQIGDGALLLSETGIRVVNDFRSADVAAGGQGAPLVPLYHAALAQGLERPLAVLNLGGVGNVTWIGEGDEILAFDTGPGNALIDDWALAHTGRPVDEDGRLARSGRADKAALAAFIHHPYFSRLPPKSLDRDDFKSFALGLVAALSPADGAATLSAFTSLACAQAARCLPRPAARWLVCGGGRHNPVLMAGLRHALDVSVDPVEVVGWDGDALEAQAFAFLAIRAVRGLPLSLPGTTGAPHPVRGGRLHGF